MGIEMFFNENTLSLRGSHIFVCVFGLKFPINNNIHVIKHYMDV